MYPNDVKVGDTVYVWGGNGFTKEVKVVAVYTDWVFSVGGDDGHNYRPGEWFHQSVTFPIPERPRRMVKKEVKGWAWSDVRGNMWFSSASENSRVVDNIPAVLTIEVPEED